MSTLRLAVVMAGGSGERFWPLSSVARPKQLLKLTHPEQTLLEEAVRRIEPLIPAPNVYVATTKPLVDAISGAGLVPLENVLVEPEKRNTLGCLCWVAAKFMATFPDDSVTIAVLTADHKIGAAPQFRDLVNKAMVAAEQTESLVTMGIRPTRPETGYGYIQVAKAIVSGEAQRAVSFHEKPSVDMARDYLADGHYLWNSGMFFWSLDAFMRELAEAQPAVHGAVLGVAEALKAGDERGAEQAFRSIPNLSVDFGLMEKAQNTLVIPAEIPWDDVGSWDSLERSFERNAEGNVTLGEVVCIDSEGCVFVNDSGAKVAVLGVSDLVVVVSDAGVLVCHKERSQEVRKIVAKIDQMPVGKA